MSQYPVNSPEGLYEAVNYLASGPSGLGQNFQGFSSYTTAYLTGNYRLPFTNPSYAELYVAPINLSNAELLDPYTWKFTFATPQSVPPFALGMGIFVAGVDPSDYDGSYTPIGVIQCTTTYVIARTQNPYTAPPYVSGGTVSYSASNTLNSTDCNARVIVYGGTDRVFISAQLTDEISYVNATGDDLTYRVQVNRYIGFLNNDPVNPDYLFLLDATVSEKVYNFTGISGSGTLTPVETIFSTVIDQPKPGYYWYILEVEFDTTGSIEVSEAKFGLRSLSAQVVKQ
jgi:hypothetical protein